jgi:hypothetical protein
MMRNFKGLVDEYSSYRLVYDNKRNFAEAYTRSVRFSPISVRTTVALMEGMQDRVLEGYKSMLNNLGRNRIEQDATADLLVVMLFAHAWQMVRQKGMPTGAGG